MANTATVRQINDAATVRKPPRFGGGEPPTPPVRPTLPIANNALVAVIVLIGAEAMFFAGLIGAYIVFRVASPVWPPPFQPRLPTDVTAVNTVVLLASAFTMRRAVRAVATNQLKRTIGFLGATAVMGAVFLAVQGFEWLRLIHFGLTVSSSVYGGLFYTLIGFHGLHVLGALIWLVVVFALAKHGRFSQGRDIGVRMCGIFWIFVVALWPVLYGLVYLY